jgi:hypothetical protein
METHFIWTSLCDLFYLQTQDIVCLQMYVDKFYDRNVQFQIVAVSNIPTVHQFTNESP